MNNNNDPFEFFQSMMNRENFGKTLHDMPNVDFSAMTSAMKNTAEAISAANQMVSENMQSIFKRGAEVVQKNTTEMYNAMKDAVAAGDLAQASTCGQKYLQSTFDNNINNTKEIVDMASKSTLEILNVVQSSIKENSDKVFKQAKK